MDFLFIFGLRRTYFENKVRSVNCDSAVSTKSGAERAMVAAAVYAAMVAAIAAFSNRDPLRAAALGAAIYAVFDGTLYVMSDRWTAQDALADVAWGAALFFASAAVGRKVAEAVESEPEPEPEPAPVPAPAPARPPPAFGSEPPPPRDHNEKA